MSIKPITYQGASNFKANLYALEIRSRFIDQSAANGYYLDYGDELKATVSSNVITIGSGAFLVQGRLNEIEAGGETVTVNMQNGRVGYIIARIETYHPSDTENCTLVARTGADFDSIVLTQNDTYRNDADSTNKVYELPLYSFRIENGAIARLEKIIEPVKENAKTREIAQEALATITAAAKKIEEAYAEIEGMLAQSYVDSCRYAKTADALTGASFAYKSGTVSQWNIALTAGKIYAIKFSAQSTEHISILYFSGDKTAQGTPRGYYGYYCRYNPLTQILMFSNKDGNMCEVEAARIREI